MKMLYLGNGKALNPDAIRSVEREIVTFLDGTTMKVTQKESCELIYEEHDVGRVAQYLRFWWPTPDQVDAFETRFNNEPEPTLTREAFDNMQDECIALLGGFKKARYGTFQLRSFPIVQDYSIEVEARGLATMFFRFTHAGADYIVAPPSGFYQTLSAVLLEHGIKAIEY